MNSYDWLTNIGSLNIENKSVLLIGGGYIAKQYAIAISKLKINDVTVITKTGTDIKEICELNGFTILTDGFAKHILNIKKMDLVIVALPIPLLVPVTELLIDNKQNNILIEKPGSLYHKELTLLSQKTKLQKIRVAYNRLVYPNFHKLKLLTEQEGGITSCRFTFTEWLNRIDFNKYEKEEYQLWGISNSLHVISMAMELIGMPKEITSYVSGKLDWHKTGSTFVGGGISEKNIPFSYHADWGSGGRWGIEVMTKKNLYQLIPLEELYSTPINSIKQSQVPFSSAFPDVKPGLAEEIALMFSTDIEKEIKLPTLDRAANYNKLAEKIFGYESRNKT